MNKKLVTIGIPAYKALSHIDQCLNSIAIQTFVDKIEVVIAIDSPEESYDSYAFLQTRYKFPIKILSCKENTGPGLARQRVLDACDTDWITFIDADDVFYTPLAIEQLYSLTKGENVIEVYGTFFQEVQGNPQIRVAPRNDIGHPWIFGRMYNVRFLIENKIEFSSLRAMEDGEFNWKIRMTIEGTPLQIEFVQDPVYFWRTGSEHSITRIGIDENGIPQYNFDLCQIGATKAAISAIKFCRERNPFNGGILRFATEMMVGQYFTYVECKARKPIFAEQNLFNAKRFYHECFKEIEHLISEKTLKELYTFQYSCHAQDLIGIIPDLSFFEFFALVKEKYNGEEELKEIRSKLPKEIIENDVKTGVSTW